MEIFYLKKSEFLPLINESSLKNFSDDREFKSVEKELEHLCGIFLTKFTAKHVYDIQNTEIEICDKKPYFKSRKIFFSVSHSKDVVMVAFNNSDIGADVQFMKENVNCAAIMKRYEQSIKHPTLKEFYRFWTVHEAEIKLNGKVRSLFSDILEDNYMISCVSNDIFVSKFSIKKLSCISDSIDLSEEFKYPKNLRFLSQ